MSVWNVPMSTSSSSLFGRSITLRAPPRVWLHFLFAFSDLVCFPSSDDFRHSQTRIQLSLSVCSFDSNLYNRAEWEQFLDTSRRRRGTLPSYYFFTCVCVSIPMLLHRQTFSPPLLLLLRRRRRRRRCSLSGCSTSARILYEVKHV